MFRLLPVFLLLVLAAVGQARQPNVILIITDDQGYGDVGFHGNEMIRTPSIDALAKQSLRLTNFHVEPTCAETRSALMSGQFPLKVGVWHTILGRSIMRADVTTMPEVFRDAGYRTGMFGKWHLGDNFPYRPQDRGFDVTLNHGGGGVGQTPDVWGNDYFDDVYLSSGQLTPVRGYCTDVFFDAAEQFITAESEQPFFCYLATNAPHGPFLVEQAYKQPYLDAGVPEPMASFYGMITNIDENLGDLLQLLEDQALARDTIVVFMTDNGTAAGHKPASDSKWKGFNAGMRGNKGAAYDGGHRVPCFIRFPDGQFANTEFGALTAHVDLLPTLARACEIDAKPLDQMDGKNLMPLLTGERQPTERTLIVQSHRVEAPRQWIKSSVMTEQWRLVSGKELYAMETDPGQQYDVSAKHPEVVEQLRSAYQAWWADCAPDPTEYSRIPLGTPEAPRVLLTAHDWHGPAPPWNQGIIARQPATNGTWQVTVERPGWYQFFLARQPLDQPLALAASSAALTVGDQTAETETNPSAVWAPITMKLDAGQFALRTHLRGTEHGEKKLGAFFVYVNYLGSKKPHSAELPEWLQAGDRIALVGGTLLERLQESGRFEAELISRLPLAGITFCNLAWSGDDASGRARAVFGAPEEGKSRRDRDLELVQPSVVLAAYGMSEALDPSVSISKFSEELRAFVLEQKSRGRKVVLCSIPDIQFDASRHTNGIRWSEILGEFQTRRKALNQAITEVATETSDLVRTYRMTLPTLKVSWFDSAQYVGSAGYAQWSRDLADSLLPGSEDAGEEALDHLSGLAAEANRLFFEMHRPQNETYLYLFRKHEQGNNAVEQSQNRPLIAELQLQLLHDASR